MGARGLGRLPAEQDLVGPNGSADILDLLVAEVGVANLKPVADLVAHRSGNADPARLSHRLQPRRHIDAVAENVAVLNNHVAKIDADAKEQRPSGRHVAVAPGHPLLKIDGAGERFGHALELDKQAVAGALDDAAPAPGDRRVYELEPDRLQARKRSGLVHLHQPAVADHVGGENRGEPALDMMGLPRDQRPIDLHA